MIIDDQYSLLFLSVITSAQKMLPQKQARRTGYHLDLREGCRRLNRI